MKPKSPTRLVTNAFLPATAAELRSNQNEISRYEHRPTPSQPMKVSEEARAEHEHEHRRREQVEVGEEAAEARVAVHVADRVQVDQRADAGDEQDHRGRERIGEEAEVDAERARLDPREAVAHVGARRCGQRVQARRTSMTDAHEREHHHRRGEPARLGLADPLAEQQQHHRAERRDRGDHPGQIEEMACGHGQPSSTFTSSAVTS